MVEDYREEKKYREKRIAQAKRKRSLVRIAWVGVIIFVVAGFLWWLAWAARHRSGPLPGTLYPAVGREHIALNDTPPAAYNSNPPSSGGHFPSPANWGIYDYEVNDKIFIHNLEHGGIWIAYKESSTPGTVVDDLKAIFNEFGGAKIVMAPRSTNNADVAIVGWTRVEKFDISGDRLSDEQKNTLRDFYHAYKDRGPEFVPDNMPGVDPKSVQ